MKAIMLAAGRGTRISKSIADVPKCTLPVGDEPLIRRTVSMLSDAGVETVVCTGYEDPQVRGALEGLDVTFYQNPFFDVTNSIASLWFARDELVGDAVIMNADVFLSKELLQRALDDTRPFVMLSDRTRTTVGDYFFSLDSEGSLRGYGKDIPVEHRDAEYVGLARISSSHMGEFRARLDQKIAKQQHGDWWEDILYSFVENHDFDIATMDVEGDFWSEIDFLDDYERILAHLSESTDTL